jgi:hypothetical protein
VIAGQGTLALELLDQLMAAVTTVMRMSLWPRKGDFRTTGLAFL